MSEAVLERVGIERGAAIEQEEHGRLEQRHCPATRCRVCGRPVHKVVGRGRPKECHTSCVEIASMIAGLEKRLQSIEFGDQAYVTKLRGDLFCLVNGPLRPDRVRFNPESEADI